MHDAFEHAFRFLAVFFVRHWVFGFLNLLLTALLGLGLLRLAFSLRLLPGGATTFARLKRFVLLCALVKGAFYLVLGDNRKVRLQDAPFAWGLQVPDLKETLFIERQTSYSIWHPTHLTFLITGLLVGLALLLLAARAFKVSRAGRNLELNVRLSGVSPPPHMQTILQRAAVAVGLRENARLPLLTIVDLDYPTPLLLGIIHPRLLLSPQLARVLTDEELEMALRHELAHFRRRDHWWRWLQIWVEDVGRLNLGSRWVGAMAVDQEEALCDRLAVRSSRDAMVLSRAIKKAADMTKAPPASVSNAVKLPDYVIPSLLGRHWAREWTPRLLSRRLHTLLMFARERDKATLPAVPKSWPAFLLYIGYRLPLWLVRFLLALLLLLLFLLVSCLKFRLLFNLHGLG